VAARPRGHALTVRRHPVVPALVVLAIAGAALMPTFRWHLSPDGVSYLSIAEHLVAGRWSAVANGYWSPLLSWSLAPFLLVGVDPLPATKLVGILAAAGTLVAVDRLLAVLPVGRRARVTTNLGLTPFTLQAAVTWIGPDLLVAVPVLVLTERVVSGAWQRSWRTAAGTGVVGGVAYLAKLYALPVVIVVLLGAVVVAARHDPVRAARRGAAIAAGALVVIAPWVLVISATEGHPTVGTAAGFNAEVLSSGSRGAPVLHDGLFAPPHPGSVSAWEDPARTTTSAGASDDPPDDHEGDERAAPSPFVRVADLTTNVPDNLATTWEMTRGLAVVALLAVAGLLAACLRPRVDGRRSRLLGTVAVAAVWAGGLQLLVAHPRYLWVAVLLMSPCVAVLIDRMQRPSPTVIAIGLTSLAWLPASLTAIDERRDDGRGAVQLAAQLSELGVTAGDDVAFDGAWNLGPTTCFHLGCRFHGVPVQDADDDAVVAALDDQGVRWYLVRDTAPSPLATTAVGEVSLPTGTTFRLHTLADR
jgi:hypothetical protein